MEKKIIETKNAPAAVGPYSQAVAVRGGRTIYGSGNLPLDPVSMEIVGTNAAEQCTRVMENMKAVLQAAGADFNDVVKVTVFLTDMDDFAAVNEVYKTFVGSDLPARSCVEVSRLPKDKSIRVEMDFIAVTE